MLLKNLCLPGNENSLISLGIRGTKITNDFTKDIVIDFNEALVFPGLINSHDHLEFNLFPKLGNRIYEDYVQWGEDIHIRNRDVIEAVKTIPYEIRFRWGLYKNLLNGFTTVAHHGNGMIYNYSGFPNIITDYNYLHSVRLEKCWKAKLNLTFNEKPFVIHIGEGTNNKSIDEIQSFLNWNIVPRRIIGVHGIRLNKKTCKKFEALVWCPDSNLFLYNRTADIAAIKYETKILFGSDSALSSDWNLWNHLRLARSLDCLNDIELYESITGTGAEVWRNKSLGSLNENNLADIIVAKRNHDNPWNAFYNTNSKDILLIIKSGRIILLDREFEEKHHFLNKSDFDLIEINDVKKYVIKGIKELSEKIKIYIPEYKSPFNVL
jgi:cytosine/adenosine deaminase-related metal-dependent hydrolase